MAEMSAYCKAYLAKDLSAYEGWKADLEALRKETREVDGKEIEVPREGLGDDDILYLHDSYIVTDGVFKDEHVVFGEVTDEWKSFCHEKLDFEVPEYEPIEIQAEAAPGDGADDAAAGDDGGDGGGGGEGAAAN